MRSVKTWLPTAIIIAAIVIQSTLVSRIAPWGVTPDIGLILLVFFSNRTGTLKGEVTGFFSGLVEDFISLSPLGFHTFIKTLTGYLYGLTRGKFFIDPVFMPLILITAATLFKYIMGGLLGAIFVSPELMEPVFSVKMGIELGLNAILSPFIFALLRLFKIFKRTDKDIA